MEMDNIGVVGLRITSSISRSVGTEIRPITTRTSLPADFDQAVDRDLPDRLVGFWHGTGDDHGVLELRRALTEPERTQIEKRIEDLRNALAPAPQSGNRALLAEITRMFMAFPQLGALDQQAGSAMAISYLTTVRNFPHWAIAEACERVRTGKAGLNPNFCPPEPAFSTVVARAVENYRRRLYDAEHLLNAKLMPPPRPPVSVAELEARLGRPIGDRPQAAIPPVIEEGDKGHAVRVAAALGQPLPAATKETAAVKEARDRIQHARRGR